MREGTEYTVTVTTVRALAVVTVEPDGAFRSEVVRVMCAFPSHAARSSARGAHI